MKFEFFPHQKLSGLALFLASALMATGTARGDSGEVEEDPVETIRDLPRFTEPLTKPEREAALKASTSPLGSRLPTHIATFKVAGQVYYAKMGWENTNIINHMVIVPAGKGFEDIVANLEMTTHPSGLGDGMLRAEITVFKVSDSVQGRIDIGSAMLKAAFDAYEISSVEINKSVAGGGKKDNMGEDFFEDRGFMPGRQGRLQPEVLGLGSEAAQAWRDRPNGNEEVVAAAGEANGGGVGPGPEGEDNPNDPDHDGGDFGGEGGL